MTHAGHAYNGDAAFNIKKLPPEEASIQATKNTLEESSPYMNGDVSEGESPLDTDSSEDMNMAPHNSSPPPPPPSKYTSREDMVRIRCSLKWTSKWGSSMQAPTPRFVNEILSRE